jgi:hypothetical protein
MRDPDLRFLVIAALRPAPDFSCLDLLHRCRRAQMTRLLRWLDQSGLALYLLHQLQEHRALDRLPLAFRQALEQRSCANRARTLDMLEEFACIVDTFDRHNVRFCALKGFTLTPDFCPAPELRHHTDLDFLISPGSLDAAERALLSRGYARQEVREGGETTFATPLRHIPSANDDIYMVPQHREVDLLPSLRLAEHGVLIDALSNPLNYLQSKTLRGVSVPTLSLEDRFALQVIHAFKHFLGSWIRASWLMEIAHFMELHRENEEVWRSIVARAGNDTTLRQCFGLIVSLTQTLFLRPIPRTLKSWCIQPLSQRLETWVQEFGVQWALSGLDGSKLTLFVHREFVQDPNSWNVYLLARIFPIGRRSSMGSTVSPPVTGDRIKAVASRWLYSMRRAAFHGRELVSLPRELIRWKLALRLVERQRSSISAEPDQRSTRIMSGSAQAAVVRPRD